MCVGRMVRSNGGFCVQYGRVRARSTRSTRGRASLARATVFTRVTRARASRAPRDGTLARVVVKRAFDRSTRRRARAEESAVAFVALTDRRFIFQRRSMARRTVARRRARGRRASGRAETVATASSASTLATCVARARERSRRADAGGAREAETLARLARDADARRAFTAWMCEDGARCAALRCRLVDVERAIEAFCGAEGVGAETREAATETLRATLAEDDDEDEAETDEIAVGDVNDSSGSSKTRARYALDVDEGAMTLAATDPATLARWLERGFARLERFETSRRRRDDVVHVRSRASKSSDADADRTEDADASAVSASGLSREKMRRDLDACDAIDDETSDRVYGIVTSWLADTRERERAARELSTLVLDGDALRLVQRRELVGDALEAWQEFRDAVVACELGREEFTGASRRIEYYLRECDRCYRRVMPDAASADALELALGEELRAYEVALRARAPSGREMSDLARSCVLAVRAVNSLDASSGASATPRVVDAGYADGETDCKVILRDARRDLRAARDDLAASVAASAAASQTMDSFIPDDVRGESARWTTRDASAADVAALHRRVRPVVERYADTALRGVVDRVVHALNREGAHLAYGIELARCAAFLALVSDAARAHAAHADDQWLRAALEAFEEDDDTRSVSRGSSRRASSSKKSMKSTVAPSRSSEDVETAPLGRAESAAPPPGAPRLAPPALELERDDAAERDHRGAWVPARSRRKSSVSATTRATVATTEDDAVVASSRRVASRRRLAPPRRAPTIPPPRAVLVAPEDDGAVTKDLEESVDATPVAVAVAVAPSVGLAGRRDFPPKPKPLGVASLRSVAEYRRMLDTESASERERRLKEFPALPLRSTASETELTPTFQPPAPPGPPPPRRPKTWAEAKRALDGVALPSLIKIK